MLNAVRTTNYRHGIEIVPSMHDETPADLLINGVILRVDDHALIGFASFRCRSQINVVDSGFNSAGFLHLLVLPFPILLALDNALAVHYDEAYFHLFFFFPYLPSLQVEGLYPSTSATKWTLASLA